MLIKLSPHLQPNHPQPLATLTLIGEKQAMDARAKVHLILNLNLILNPAQHYFISKTRRRPYSMTESYETRSSVVFPQLIASQSVDIWWENWRCMHGSVRQSIFSPRLLMLPTKTKTKNQSNLFTTIFTIGFVSFSYDIGQDLS